MSGNACASQRDLAWFYLARGELPLFGGPRVRPGHKRPSATRSKADVEKLSIRRSRRCKLDSRKVIVRLRHRIECALLSRNWPLTSLKDDSARES